MATLTKQWSDGTSLTAIYVGSGKGTIVVKTVENEGLDRSMTITIKTSDDKLSRSVTINQIGKREYFNTSDGSHLVLSDGTPFLVLK